MNVCTLSDKELITVFCTGSAAAFEELLNRHKVRVYSYILMMVKNRDLAEDIFQETFIKVINTLKSGRYNEEGKFLPWVMRIAHNIVIDHYRRGKKISYVRSRVHEEEGVDVFSFLKHSDTSPEERLIQLQTNQRVQQLIRYLPQDQKDVLIMRAYAGLSFQEIAEQTNVSINTALGRMRYALINLRKLIRRHCIQLGD